MPKINYRSITSQLLVEEAEKMGIQVNILKPTKNFFILTKGEKSVHFKSNDFGWNTSLWKKIADDKELAAIFLDHYNFPTPKNYYLKKENKSDFDISQTSLSYPLAVKPIDGAHGNGVTANITSSQILQEAMESAFSFSDTIIIQEFIPGDEYRILVIGDQVALGMRRVPAHVVGDGIQTIEELICQENKNPLRAPGYGIDLSHIPMNENTITYLQRHGLTLSSIPQNGEKIQLTSVSNLWQWGTAEVVTDQICDEIKQQCVAIAQKVWLVVIGLDIITTDISQPLQQSGGSIIEFNATPGFSSPMLVSTNLAKILLEYIFNENVDH